ncbi:MAG TPA: hypothetical protein VGO80_11770 [Solirubrobacteraceae bacterium]|nr:hypothetical protein [Solirubrobacteraceae bacterium]
MSCNNEVTTADLVVAVAPEHELEPETLLNSTISAVLNQLDVARLTIAITRETGENAARGSLAAEIGDFAEAEVVSALAEQGLDIVHMNTQPSEKGIDIVAVDAKTDAITVFEVKATLNPNQAKPTLSNTKTGKQASQSWVNARLEAAGLDNTQASDVNVTVVHLNLFNGTMQSFSVDEHGGDLTATSGPVAMEDAP